MENIYDTFTEVVAEGRSLEKTYVDEIGQGRVWSGDDAVRLKLADRTGTIMDAVRYAATAGGEASADLAGWNIAEYPEPQNAIEMLMNTIGGTASASVFGNTPFEDIETAFKDWNASQAGKFYARLPYEQVIR